MHTNTNTSSKEKVSSQEFIMSAQDAAGRAQAAATSNKGWSAGVDHVSKGGVSGSAGVKVYESKSGNVNVGVGASVSKDFHGGKPQGAAGVGVNIKF